MRFDSPVNMSKAFTYFIVVSMALTACYKEQFATNSEARLSFSTDTVFFDTVFTQITTVTQIFKIYNSQDKSIIIKEAYLAGGNNSPYRLNIDGQPGTQFTNLNIHPNDSMFVFVDVTIDPHESNNPMVVTDSIVFNTAAGSSEVKLVAFGQDVHLFKSKVIKSQTWSPGKPYLIYNGVAIDTNNTLRIEAGTKIYLHDQSSLLVWGTLQVDGTFENPVIFSGDRSDRGYGISAGQWGTIYIDPDSRDSYLRHAIIKNAQAGFQLGRPGIYQRLPEVTLYNCFIQNSSFAAVYSFRGKMDAFNTIIADCGTTALFLLQGGEFNFYHCTISNVSAYYSLYGNSGIYYPRSEPSVILSNYVPYYAFDRRLNLVDTNFYSDLTSANFYNSIINGANRNEFQFINKQKAEFNYMFDHCLMKISKDTLSKQPEDNFTETLYNIYPRFLNDSLTEGFYNFALDTLSPAKDAGSITIVDTHTELLYDYEGKLRTRDGLPDIGAIERYE